MHSVVYERLFHLGLCLILISGEVEARAEWKDGCGGGERSGPLPQEPQLEAEPQEVEALHEMEK